MEKLNITIQSGSPIKLARCFTCCHDLCNPHPHFHCPNCLILFHTEYGYLEHLPKCLDGKEVTYLAPKEEKESKPSIDVGEKVGQFGPWDEGGQIIVKVEDDWDQIDQQLHIHEIGQDGCGDQRLEQSVYGDIGEQGNAWPFKELMTSVASKPHITIQSGSPIKLAKCFTCEKFHCPFCKPEVYKPTVKSKLKSHIAAHKKRAVHYKGYIIFKCNLLCSPHAHFHCPNCPMLIHKRNRYLDHLPKCLNEIEEVHLVPEEEEGKTHTDVGEMVGQSGSRGERDLIIVKLEDDQDQINQQLHIEDQKMDYTASEQTVWEDDGEGNAQVHLETMASVAQVRSISKLLTVIQSGSTIKLARCFTCCKKFHCPFCKPQVFKPTVESKLKNHIVAHQKRAIHFRGYTIFKCNNMCNPHAHFHCPNCPMIVHKKNRYLEHLPKCFDGKVVSQSVPKEKEEDKTHTDVEEKVGQFGSWGEGAQIIVKLEDDQDHIDQQLHREPIWS